MRKFSLFSGILAVAGTLAAGGWAAADIITNGDFEAGNTGFTSQYIADSTIDAGAVAGTKAGAGYYGIVTDSQFWHPSFTDFKDHTSGSGNMMIVNATDAADVTVWSEGGISLTPGATYQFSFWAASAYPVSPATLHVTTNDNSLDQTFSLTSNAGAWEQFTTNFVAGHSPLTINLIDTNLELSGNDFALDDFSLTQVASTVPIPESAWGGGFLILGLAALQKFRRAQAA
ncbi:MAG TPA: hypothetical protein VFE58_02605 [Tepidisphaeraceae bacterium]|nr:hypothetical protein [Tepidisphaeraceae bacterium]